MSRIRKVDLRKTLFVLPNMVTLAAVFCGFNAVRVVAMDDPGSADFYKAAIFLVFSMLFDLLDGRIARMTRTQSAFGLQLDSLADIVSFGLAPSILLYKWSLYRWDMIGVFGAFLFTACGAVRLARFNVLSSDPSGTPSKPGKYVLGLPTPAAAGILISLLLANYATDGAIGAERYTGALFGLTVGLSFLMVSTVKFRSFKDVKFNWATTALVVFAVGSSVAIWSFTKPQFVLVWLLACYIVIGLFETARAFLLGFSSDASTLAPLQAAPSQAAAPTELDVPAAKAQLDVSAPLDASATSQS